MKKLTTLLLLLPVFASAQTFNDVPTDYWAYSSIEDLAASGITGGCGGGNYCPEGLVTRAQMAVFLERGMNGSSYSPPAASGNVFLDVGAQDFAASFIEQLANDGITGGCGNSNYCPDAVVTRAQMAVFLLRAKYGSSYSPPPATGIFGDVDLGHWAVHWIEQLAAEGITGGCGGGNYCPEDSVTRAQMAVFLVRAFGLDGPPASLIHLFLSVGSLDPAFESDIFSYETYVDSLEISVTPISLVPSDTITINGVQVLSGDSRTITLDLGLNGIVIDVVSQDGATENTYTIIVNRFNNDAELSSLVLTAGDLQPSFDPGHLNYFVETNKRGVIVTPTAVDFDATILVNNIPVESGSSSPLINLPFGTNLIEIEVTANGGLSRSTYIVEILVLSDNVLLSELSLSAGELEPVFSLGRVFYNVTVASDVASTTVTAVAIDSDATVRVNGVKIGTTSGDIALAIGDNVITVNVVAEDGVTSRNYIVTVRRLNNDASLSNISFSAGVLDQMFLPQQTDYTMTVANDFTIATPVTSHPNAVVQIGNQVLASGETGGPFNLDLGLNIIIAQVTAEDGTTTRAYFFEVTRVVNTIAELSDLVPSTGWLSPAFSPQVLNYTVDLGYLASHISVTPFTNRQSSISVNGVPAGTNNPSDYVPINVGGSVVTIEVLAEDGMSSNEYMVTVSRSPANSVVQEAILQPNDPVVGVRDGFGYATSVFGNSLAVAGNGSTRVFDRDVNGSWSQVITLNSSGKIDSYGDALVLANTGVTVFSRTPSNLWMEQARLTGANTESTDNFGKSVAIFDNTIVVGALTEDSAATGVDGDANDNSAHSAGAAYVFARDITGKWSQQAYLKESNTAADDLFGESVAIHKDQIIVGARTQDAVNVAAPVFSRDASGTWIFETNLSPSNPDDGDIYGSSVAIWGETAAVGAPREDSPALGLNGDQGNAPGTAESSGAVYLFTRGSFGVWNQDYYIKPPTAECRGGFGAQVSLNGDFLVVSGRSGCRFVYHRDSSGVWSHLTQYDGVFLGDNHDVSGDKLATGLPNANSYEGIVRVYR